MNKKEDPKDIAKIVHVYRTMQDVPGYARRVPVSEITTEDFNCNIRRYVDNAPPLEPHDVRAHLHGGVPVAEIDALNRFWSNYPGLRELVLTQTGLGYQKMPRLFAQGLREGLGNRLLARRSPNQRSIRAFFKASSRPSAS
jgi:N-6 DNA Methylase